MRTLSDNSSTAGAAVQRPPIIITPVDLAPVAPSNLQAQAVPGQVRLTWQDNSFNEDGFKVRRQGPADAGFVDIATVGANVTGFNDTSVQPNTTYIYRIRAFNAAGGAASNDAVVTTPGIPLPAIPAAPSGLAVTALAPTQVALLWQDNSNNEDGFKVRRQGPADVGFVDIGATAPNITGFTDTTAQPNTTYIYRVRSFNAAGGAASNDAVVTTPSIIFPTIPAAPSTLTVSALSATQVALSWRDNSNNEEGFKVRRQGPGDAGFVDIASLPANTTSYTDSAAQPGTTYTYRVRAFNASGGSMSNDAMATTPANDARNIFTMDTRTVDPILVAGASTAFVAGRFEKFTRGVATQDFVNARVSISPAEPTIGLSLFPGNPIETFQPVRLTITTTTDTPARPYVITIDGVSSEDGKSYTPGRIPLTVTPPPKVTLDVSPNMQTVRAGTPARYEVRLQRDAFSQGVQVELSVNEGRLPAGVRVSFDPSAPTGNRSTMTVTTDRVELPDVIELRVRGRTPGVLVEPVTARLKIQPEVTISVTPSMATLNAGQSQRFDLAVTRMGYAGALKIAPDFRAPKPMFSASTTPSDFDTGSIFQTEVQIKPGTPGGNYTLFARPMFPNGASVLFNEIEVPVRVNADSVVQLAADKTNVGVRAGDSEGLAIGVSSIMPTGLRGRVELTLDGSALPPGVSVKFDGAEDEILMVEPGAASLLEIAADDFAGGSGSFTVNGRYLDGTSVDVLPVTVMVQAVSTSSVVVDFALSAVRSVPQGQRATFSLLLTAVGYAGDVTLSVPNLPPGVPTAAFSMNPVRVFSSQGTVPVNLSFDTANVPIGTYKFSLIGSADPGANVIVLRDGTLDVTVAPVVLPTPQVDGFSPGSGMVGTSVTLTGRNFAAGAQVTFNGVPASSQVVSSSRIETVVPPGASSGKIGVKTSGASAFSAADFAVLAVRSVALSATPRTLVASPGQQVRYLVGLARSNYAGPVELAVDGLPPGAVANFSETPAFGSAVTLEVQLPWGVGGIYALTITGSAAGIEVVPAGSVLSLRARPGGFFEAIEDAPADIAPARDAQESLQILERELALLKAQLT